MIDILLAALGLLAGLGLAWAARYCDLQLGEVSKTTVILLPLLMYLIVSGKLAVFELQGLKAEFRKVTTESVVDTARAVDLAISDVETNEPNFSREALFQECRAYHVISRETAAKGDASSSTAGSALDQDATINIAKAIRASLLCEKFQGIVIVDKWRKPIGFFPRNQFLELLRLPIEVYGEGRKCSPIDVEFCEMLFKEISAGELGIILSFPEERAKSEEAHNTVVPWNASLGDMYKKMINAGVSVAMIADRHGRFDGIITKSAIESRVVGKLIEATN